MIPDFDFETIGKALEFAAKGTKAADSAFGLAKRIKETFGSSKPTPEKTELEGLLLDLMQEMTDTKLANVDLKEQLIALREHALEARAREQKFECYELFETEAGTFALQLKADHRDGTRNHFICTNCKEEGRVSILQGGEYKKNCPACKTVLIFKHRPIPSRQNNNSWIR